MRKFGLSSFCCPFSMYLLSFCLNFFQFFLIQVLYFKVFLQHFSESLPLKPGTGIDFSIPNIFSSIILFLCCYSDSLWTSGLPLMISLDWSVCSAFDGNLKNGLCIFPLNFMKHIPSPTLHAGME